MAGFFVVNDDVGLGMASILCKTQQCSDCPPHGLHDLSLQIRLRALSERPMMPP